MKSWPGRLTPEVGGAAVSAPRGYRSTSRRRAKTSTRRSTTFVWRVVLANVLILLGDALALALAPSPDDSSVRLNEAVVVLAGLMLLIAVNTVLVRRALRPLHQLRERVAEIETLGSEQQLPDDSNIRDVSDLTRAFNIMFSRLAEERRESTVKVLAGQERERRRLSRELHDEVGQTLSAALLALQPGPGEVAEEVRAQLSEATEMVREGLEGTRRVAHALRPELLDQLGLVTALSSLARRMTRDIDLDLQLPTTLPLMTDETLLAIYRIAQETLTNVVHHADASRVVVTLSTSAEDVRLVISDDGRGPGDAGFKGDGYGIVGMLERARAINAVLVVRSGATGGAEVELTVPLPANVAVE